MGERAPSTREGVSFTSVALGVALCAGTLLVVQRAFRRAQRGGGSDAGADALNPRGGPIRRRHSSSPAPGFAIADIVAGHSISSRRKPRAENDPVAIVRRRTFLKPLQSGERGDRERAFYEQHEAAAAMSSCSSAISSYSGCQTIQGVQYLQLDNIEADFTHPCTVDIKLGRELRHPSVDEAKKRRGRKKWKYMAKTATAICGMKVFRPCTPQIGTRCTDGGGEEGSENPGAYARWQKGYGRSLKADGMAHALLAFLHNGNNVRTDVINGLKKDLGVVRRWLTEETQHECYSMSVLLCYDGNVNMTSGENRENPLTRAVLVDFAHAYELKGKRDESVQIQDCVAGVDQILESLQLIGSMFDQLAVT